MATETISPTLQEFVVAIAYKAADERIKEYATTREDLAEVKAALHELATAQARTEKRVEELAAAQARTEKQVEELAAAQARTEKQVEELAAAQARTEKQVEELAAAQARTEERLGRLEEVVERLAAAQARTEKRVEELAAAQARTEQTIGRMQDRLGRLVGRQLEQDYRDKAYAYLGHLLRRVRVVSVQEIEDRLQAHLPEDQLFDLILLDVLVSGWPRQQPDAEVWLAVEVSAVIDPYDVERAKRRAAALRRAGYRAIPAVAGEQVTVEAEQAARADHVLLLQDGRVQFWEEALADALIAVT